MKATAITDIGKTRAVNQDYIYTSVDRVGCLPNLFIVADGMGGHKAGDMLHVLQLKLLKLLLNSHREKMRYPLLMIRLRWLMGCFYRRHLNQRITMVWNNACYRNHI
ncbi:MAG: hypothetical protein ACLS9K_00115 [Lachnospira eligens]